MKIYLTRAATRSMSLDHPVGDPTGGPAYGEKNDPVSAIISIATMATTGGAVLAGTATLFQGLAFAGAALSLTGNVTGNKTLSKLGMVVGIAGGVGMLGEAAFGMSSPTMGETFGYGAGATPATAAPSAFDAANPNAPSAGVTPEAVVTAPGEVAPPAATGTVNQQSVAARIASDPSAGAQGINAPSAGNYDLLNTSGPALGDPGLQYRLGADLGTSTGSLSPTSQMGLTPNSSDWLYQTGKPTPSVMESFRAGNYGQALGKAGSNVMDLAKTNPSAAMVMGQATIGLTDWLSGKTDAEIDALQAQTGFSNAKALEVQELLAREKRRRANLSAGYTQVNAGIKVNPNAQIQQPWAPQQPAGLIAGARG
jgi:hypothetical protein